MSWSTLRAAIKSILDTLVTDTTLGVVFNGEQLQTMNDIGAWPAAELVRLQTEPDYFTNREDLQTYVFLVNIYSKLPALDTATAETDMDAVLDTIMQAFLDDASLGGAADGRLMPIQNAASVVSWQGQQVRRDQIVLKYRKITAMS